MTGPLRSALAEPFVLGEGPVWDATRGRVLWVDIQRGSVLSAVLDDDLRLRVVDRVVIGGTVGAVAPAVDGRWLLAGAKRLLVRAVDGTLTVSDELLPPSPRRRLNDGKPDPAGRFVVGTLSLDGPSESESLLSIDASGGVREIDGDLSLSNGLAWSADGRSMYSVDTFRRTIHVRDYDPGTGATGARRAFARLDDGYPDGICLDTDGGLWVAVWGRGEVLRLDARGDVAARLAVPAPHVSSVAFAGPDLDVLVVTTASDELSPDELARHPESGRVFTTRPGVHGLPQAPWNGRLPTE